jgi:hypothetical protein
MSDILKTILGIGAIFVALPLAILFLRDRLSRPSRKKLDEYARRFNQRLANPDFAALEQHFGRPLPAALRTLYLDPQERMRDNFEVAPSVDAPRAIRWQVAYCQPADAESLRDMWPGTEELFAFADDGCGNAYLVDPRLPDPPVLFHDHESGEMEPVCDRLSEFMHWPRIEGKE